MNLNLWIKEKENAAFEEGLTKGKAEGKEEGKAEGRCKAFAEMVSKKLISITDAAKILGMSEEVFRKTYMS